MLTPWQEQELQQQPQQLDQQDSTITDDTNVEALLFNYLQVQQQSPQSEPDSVAKFLPVGYASPELIGLPSPGYMTAATSPISFNPIASSMPLDSTNNLFQSPQLPYSFQPRRQSESSTGNSDGFTSPYLSISTIDFQHQHDPAKVDESWGHPLLDMLQATVHLDNGSYCRNVNNTTTISTPSSFSSSSTITTPTKGNHTDTKNIRLEANSFSDLKNILESMQNQIGAHFLDDDLHTSQQHRRKRRKSRRSHMVDMEQQQLQERRQAAAKAASILPIAVRDTVDTAYFLPLLMEKAQRHWCCVGFKVAPVTLDMVKHWRQAPITIIYSMAAIVLVTIMDHSAGQAYAKTAAMVFYEQARRKLDDVVFDDEEDVSNYNIDGNGYYDDDDGDTNGTGGDRKKAMTIQSYFCLSYTSNLLRLYDQQQTWGCLASIALQLRTKDAETGCRPMDQAIFLCYCRWYYVDAWMALTLQRECLLSEAPPRFILDIIQRTTTASTAAAIQGTDFDRPRNTTIPPPTTLALPQEHQSLYHFAILAKFMRRFIRVLRSDKLMDPVTLKPSPYYYAITNELQQWYHTVLQQQKEAAASAAAAKESTMIGPRSLGGQGGAGKMEVNGGFGGTNDDDPGSGVHLHLCYNAMRLVIIYKFLHSDILDPDDAIFMDGLETSLTILQSLQQLVLQGCDQSTYHHMFFAIHNTSSRIYQYHTKNRNSKWQRWAKQQLQMNLVLLKGTQAYVNDVFQMREHAEKIEEQFKHMGLVLSPYYRSTLASMEKQQQILLQQQQTLEKNWVESLMTAKEDNTASPPSLSSPYNALLKLPLPSRPPTTAMGISTPATDTSTTNANSSCATIPGMHIYKLHTAATVKKPRNSTKNKQVKKLKTTFSSS